MAATRKTAVLYRMAIGKSMCPWGLRAKSLLQSALGISEADAFRWIQKTAMDLRMSAREVAEQVVEKGPGLGAS